jgi:predicted  nucleic acid-binding Zn-ribbon protein
MATNGKKPRDLLAERITRLEKQGAETNKRLDRIEGILGGIANVLVGQGKELERHSQLLERHSQLLQALVDRFDRFSDAMIIGRTRDTERVGDLERRMEVVERRVFGETPPSRD